MKPKKHTLFSPQLIFIGESERKEFLKGLTCFTVFLFHSTTLQTTSSYKDMTENDQHIPIFQLQICMPWGKRFKLFIGNMGQIVNPWSDLKKNLSRAPAMYYTLQPLAKPNIT